MKNWKVVVTILVGLLGICSGCVEQPTATPNSDQGHLFVNLEQGLAVGWESSVLIMGPATGQQHCDERRGCYPDTEKVEMLEVRSTDPSVVSVEGFEADSYGQSEAVRIDLEVHEEGEASLEFEFRIDGREPPKEEEKQPDQNEEEGDEDQGANQEPEADLDPDLWTDSYGVQARQVESVQLSRLTEKTDTPSPYARCPERAHGVYLMSTLGDYVVELALEKRDEQGNLLRGSGRFPFVMEPEGVVEIEEGDEALHRVTLVPKQFGAVTLSPTGSGSNFEASFRKLSEVASLEAKMFRLNQEGLRAAEVSYLVVDGVYEVEARPELSGGAPLCGGSVETSVQTLTPATCDIVGEMADTGNSAIAATHGGECHLQIAIGSDGPVEHWAYPVEYDW